MGDFIDIEIDDGGLAYVDACHGWCENGGAEGGRPLGAIGTLAQGPALRGPLAPLAPLR